MLHRGHNLAPVQYDMLAFSALDGERYHWIGRSARNGAVSPNFIGEVVVLLPYFEADVLGRVLFEAGPMLRHLKQFIATSDQEGVQRITKLYCTF